MSESGAHSQDSSRIATVVCSQYSPWVLASRIEATYDMDIFLHCCSPWWGSMKLELKPESKGLATREEQEERCFLKPKSHLKSTARENAHNVMILCFKDIDRTRFMRRRSKSVLESPKA
jgi:hypothetical protein